MKITVVTIAFNEEKNIARTIESVLKQTAADYEYIVCDGLSQDRTLSIAKSYRDDFAKKGISYRVFSEKDQGIYDAMNKGISHAQGRYIYFLNAGDWFCNETVLGKYEEAICAGGDPAVLYADYYYVENHRATLIPCDDARLWEEMSIGHPAMIARTDLMRECGFDTAYRVAADYNFVLGLKMRGLAFVRLEMTATYFMGGGISGTARELTNEELRRIHTSYGLPHEDIVFVPPNARTRLKQALASALPVALWRLWTEKVKCQTWVEY